MSAAKSAVDSTANVHLRIGKSRFSCQTHCVRLITVTPPSADGKAAADEGGARFRLPRGVVTTDANAQPDTCNTPRGKAHGVAAVSVAKPTLVMSNC